MRATSLHKALLALALLLIGNGVVFAVVMTAYEASKPCWLGVLMFDGELNALDWTGWGAVIAAGGFVILLADLGGIATLLAGPRDRLFRWQSAGTILISLYWTSAYAAHVVLETLQVRWIDTGLQPFMMLFLMPSRFLEWLVKTVTVASCEQSYFVFVEGALLGSYTSVLGWWLIAALAAGRLRFHGTAQADRELASARDGQLP